MSIYESIPVKSGLLFALVPALGSILDQSGNGRHPVVAGTPGDLEWARIRGVDQLSATGTGRLVVPNDLTLQGVTDFSLFAAGSFQDDAGTRRFVQKSGHLEVLNFGGVARLRLQTTATTVNVNLGTWVGVNSFCINSVSGSVPRISTNGVDFGPFDGISTSSPNSVDLTVLNQFNGGSPWLYPLRALLWYSRSIDAEENSMLNAWSESLKSPRLPFDRRYFDFGSTVPNGNDGGVIASYDFGVISKRECADKSGGGSHGSLAGGVAPVFSEAGRALEFDGVTGYVDVTGVVSTSKSYTLSATLLVEEAGAAQFLFATQTDFFIVTPRAIAAGTAGFYDGAWKSYGVGSGCFGKYCRFVFVFDGVAGKSRLYIDGEQSGSEVAYTPVDLGGAVRIGMHPTTIASAFDGQAVDLILENRVVTLAEIKADYLKLASRVMFSSALDQVRVTLADKTSGQIGPYTIDSGTWKVDEDATTGERYIECVVAGVIWRPNPLAYGAYRTRFHKEGSNSIDYVPIATKPGVFTTPGQYGYLIQLKADENLRVYRVDNGAIGGTLMVGTAGYLPAPGEVELCITRTAVGVASIYTDVPGYFELMGGITTGANPATDNTHKTSMHSVFDMDPGDRLYEELQHFGVFPPL